MIGYNLFKIELVVRYYHIHCKTVHGCDLPCPECRRKEDAVIGRLLECPYTEHFRECTLCERHCVDYELFNDLVKTLVDEKEPVNEC